MNILFMCVANSARSQMAESLARSIFPPNYKIMSAGSKPTFVNPFAIQVLSEIGLTTDSQTSKVVELLPPDFVHHLDCVITLCQEEVCPIIFAPAAKRLHWPFPDPAQPGKTSQESLELFRQTRNALAAKIKEFRTEL